MAARMLSHPSGAGDGRLHPPQTLALESARTARTTPCSAASGMSAASTKFEVVPIICGGLGVALSQQAGGPTHR
jgi:hypothetical protein